MLSLFAKTNDDKQSTNMRNDKTAWSAAPAKSLYQGNSETEILTFRPFGFSCKKFPAVIFLGKNAPVSPLRVVVSVGT